MTYSQKCIIVLIIACFFIGIYAEPALSHAGKAGESGNIYKEVNIKNYDYSAGIGVPVFKNDAIDVGIGGRVNGNMRYNSRPDYGVGLGMRFSF